jgi:hypothetical protein
VCSARAPSRGEENSLPLRSIIDYFPYFIYNFPMKKYFLIIGATLLHAAISMWFLLAALGISLLRFDGKEITSGQRVVEFFSIILTSPLFYPVSLLPGTGGWFPGLFGYVPLFLNSLLWVLAIRWAYRRFRYSVKLSL